jgi:hypothetical protein
VACHTNVVIEISCIRRRLVVGGAKMVWYTGRNIGYELAKNSFTAASQFRMLKEVATTFVLLF